MSEAQRDDPGEARIIMHDRLSWAFRLAGALTLNRSISIVVPAYNESARLPDTIRRIEAYFAGSAWDFHEIIVVDDGSSDTTFGTASVFARTNPNVRVLKNPGNRGEVYSVRHWMQEARGE